MSMAKFSKHALMALALSAVTTLAPRFSAAADTYDVTSYQALAKATLALVAAGDVKGAAKKELELESAWDAKDMRDKLPAADSQMDAVKDALGSGDAKKATTELNKYLDMLQQAAKPAG